jgi:uncharacterized membrane protein AbrB (regulator of aidB expression)
MNKKWDYADKWHVAVSGTIAAMIMVALCYLFITQAPVPELLQGMAWMILGYFFGAQTQKFTNGRNHKANAAAALEAAAVEREIIEAVGGH